MPGARVEAQVPQAAVGFQPIGNPGPRFRSVSPNRSSMSMTIQIGIVQQAADVEADVGGGELEVAVHIGAAAVEQVVGQQAVDEELGVVAVDDGVEVEIAVTGEDALALI